MSAFPTYPLPWLLALELAGAILTGRCRSFREDSRYCLSLLRPPLRLLGEENVPSGGPALITMNHYYRPGFRAWWLALGISAVVPAEIHWVMTAAWTYPGQFLGRQRTAATRWVFARVAQVYGFTTMPPMPPTPEETEARARAVRRVLRAALTPKRCSLSPPSPNAGRGESTLTPGDSPKGRGGAALIGISPEGGDNLMRTLIRPPSGVGRFVLHLNRLGLPIYPVGAFEQDGAFTLHFGPPYQLEIQGGLPADERDRQAADSVMRRIAVLLPPSLRGEFG